MGFDHASPSPLMREENAHEWGTRCFGHPPIANYVYLSPTQGKNGLEWATHIVGVLVVHSRGGLEFFADPVGEGFGGLRASEEFLDNFFAGLGASGVEDGAAVPH